MVEIMKVSEAKARLSELIAKAERGEMVLIARGNKPAVRLVPLESAPKERTPGRLSHWVGYDDKALFDSEADQDAIDAGDYSDELGIWVGRTKSEDEDKKARKR